MSTLKTDYKDDVFTGKRKYNQINNGDGTISFDDVTEYAQVGDSYGAVQINETNDVINNLDSKAYKNTDSAENSIADNDYFPFFDVSASASKKTLWSNVKSVLTNVFAIKTHASNTTVYGTGNANLYGHVKLSDNYTSSAGAASAAVGASSKAVNDAYNANKNSITTLSGTVSTNAATETNHYNALVTRTTNLETRATTLEGELTANRKRIYMDYKNGKYGINTSANRGADTFIPFNSLEGARKIYDNSFGGLYVHTASFSVTSGEWYVFIYGDHEYAFDGWRLDIKGATVLLQKAINQVPFGGFWSFTDVMLLQATSNTITLNSVKITKDHDFEHAYGVIWQLTGV